MAYLGRPRPSEGDGVERATSYAVGDEAHVSPRTRLVSSIPTRSGTGPGGWSATNFHCYGLAIERLTGRQFWQSESGEWRVYNDVGQIVEARPGRASSAPV